MTDIGAHRPGDPRGWLVFEQLPDDMQRAEDSTQHNDYEQRHWRASMHRDRPATDTERALLAHLGYALPGELTTRVQWLSNGVRRRTWPQLEGHTP
ncbi:hypothetical protein MMAG44476_23127 [Mycolicibacterium mageritense DSM 44476 = CIP 104973]|uniref:Uncharacterized protein n=1 Tax=Mycolicibacterium mageritense TaxID=53462 RepID=A0ABM7HTN7_MYCME|nr:hypothetical protein [Mycolicibacterium mageritense]MCC9186736.1 hypothetical protein [Mycolicibacterium mageritense]BBX33935.1 hypothetical protein MMAGJ_32170 [Mycolicibacterium mageritense]CDO22355.1 hypothetical protein BN978_02828 [Mycolicibacterium mageritense DSM 44476 = CIP 104973]